FFFSSRRRHTRFSRDWSSDVCSSDLIQEDGGHLLLAAELHPGAEPLLVEATGEGVVLSANTGTAGPGYHRHVCDLARELASALRSEERRVGKEGTSPRPAHH